MYGKILVPLDGSKLAECVLPHIEALAKGCKAKSVILLRVVEPFVVLGKYPVSQTTDPKAIDAENKAKAEEYLDHVARRLNFDGAKIKTEVVMGNAVETITDYATKNKVDLIIIATHGRSGVSRWVWGSVADRVLRSSCVPVFMVRAPGCVPGI